VKSHFASNEAALRDAVKGIAEERGPHSGNARQMVRRLIRFYAINGHSDRAAEYREMLATVYALPADLSVN
jgi:hypothetical protein